jgi:hypothetical protein
MHDFDPFDVLIGDHNRINGLEEAIRQLQRNQLELTEMIRKQNDLVRQCRHNEEQLRIAHNHQADLTRELIDQCVKINLAKN